MREQGAGQGAAATVGARMPGRASGQGGQLLNDRESSRYAGEHGLSRHEWE